MAAQEDVVPVALVDAILDVQLHVRKLAALIVSPVVYLAQVVVVILVITNVKDPLLQAVFLRVKAHVR